MSVFMSGNLSGPTSSEITHGPSQSKIKTMAPIDNGGDGSSFSPTDLCAASLASCAATTIGLYAKRNNIPLNTIRFEIEKEMNPSPRRLGVLRMKLVIDSSANDTDFARLVEAGKTCPVRRSLHSDVVVEESYERA